MKRLLDLDKADRDLKEALTRYEVIKLHVLHLEQEIFTLNVCEFNLEQNIDILKNAGTIATVAEFKRSRDELEKVRNRMVFLRIDRSNHLKSLANAEKKLNECKERYAEALIAPVGKVLKGKFGKDDGQE